MTIAGYYVGTHRSQYQVGVTNRTRREGCVWTTGSNGADASSGGRVNKTPDQVLALVLPYEETNPATLGWSLGDLHKAMTRLGVPFELRSGWVEVENAHRAGHYVSIPGDSDRFGNNTCSGAFDGDHNIGAHPASRTNPEGVIEWWIDDPICPRGRWESVATLRAYAQKFNPAVQFGVFLNPVPRPPTRFNVGLGMYTPMFDKANGTRVGAARRVSYVCTRARDAQGVLWYRVVSRLDGSAAHWAGRWFQPNAGTKVTVA